MSENSNEVALVALDMTDPSSSVRDPAFTSLLKQGYRVQAHLPAMRGNKQEWMMLLCKEQTGLAYPPSVSLSPKDRWLILAAVAIQSITGALVLAGMFGG